MRSIVFLIVLSLVFGCSSAQSDLKDDLNWNAAELSNGISVQIVSDLGVPTAQLMKINGSDLPYKGISAENLYYALLDLGLQHQSDIGFQESADRLFLWGGAKTLAGRVKYMVQYDDAGIRLYTVDSAGFNPSRAMKYFPEISDLSSDGKFSDVIEAFADPSSELKTNFERIDRVPSKTAKATPVQQSEPRQDSSKSPAVSKSQLNWPEPKSDSERQKLAVLKKAFPMAKSPPPLKYKLPNGSLRLVLYHKGDDQFHVFDDSDDLPRMATLQTDIKSDKVRESFAFILKDLGIRPTKRSDTLEAPEWRRMHGARYWAEMGEAKYRGKKVRYFVDLYHNTVQIIVATPEDFESWGGPIAPLVMNGYIRDPGNFPATTAAGLGDLPVGDQAKVYVTAVNRKMENATMAYAANMHGMINMMLQNGINAEFSQAMGN